MKWKSAVLDKQIKIYLMKIYFTADAWKIVKQLYETKKIKQMGMSCVKKI